MACRVFFVDAGDWVYVPSVRVLLQACPLACEVISCIWVRVVAPNVCCSSSVQGSKQCKQNQEDRFASSPSCTHHTRPPHSTALYCTNSAVLHYLRNGSRSSGFLIWFWNPDIQVRNSGNQRIRVRNSENHRIRARNSRNHLIRTRNFKIHCALMLTSLQSINTSKFWQKAAKKVAKWGTFRFSRFLPPHPTPYQRKCPQKMSTPQLMSAK